MIYKFKPQMLKHFWNGTDEKQQVNANVFLKSQVFIPAIYVKCHNQIWE